MPAQVGRLVGVQHRQPRPRPSSQRQRVDLATQAIALHIGPQQGVVAQVRLQRHHPCHAVQARGLQRVPTQVGTHVDEQRAAARLRQSFQQPWGEAVLITLVTQDVPSHHVARIDTVIQPGGTMAHPGDVGKRIGPGQQVTQAAQRIGALHDREGPGRRELPDVVPEIGIEPTTSSLRMTRSTN